MTSYIKTSLKSSWCVACTMLKSNLASSSKVGFMPSLLAYISINHLASNLGILQCSGILREWLTSMERCWALFLLMNSPRCLVVKSLACSKTFSPSTKRYDASYKYNIPLVSSQRCALKFPNSSLKLLKSSAINQEYISHLRWIKLKVYLDIYTITTFLIF